ncbi:MAG: N-acyl homoserine lactonase family protein [SAR324 cluster bacterium]|nr:N-acyl homoserine lactonase family protein [SAR324 cluster bacterium]
MTRNEPEIHQIFAVKYARHERERHYNFIAADPHDGIMPLDYFVWAIVNENRTIIVDTGFDHEEAKNRNRQLLRLPKEGLAMIGVDAAVVKDVIITHLHYDHAGTSSDFPNAKFHLQDLEMSYASGRSMRHAPLKSAYSVEHVVDFVRHLYAGRVIFHGGDSMLAPGISLHHIGGHTMGIQSVRVFTRRGWVVLASDAAHFYENMEKAAPFPIVYNVADMVEGFDRLRSLAESEDHIIPGHDPLVMERYPAPNPDLEGVVVRLDVPPF